jgi:hypothetical protein
MCEEYNPRSPDAKWGVTKNHIPLVKKISSGDNLYSVIADPEELESSKNKLCIKMKQNQVL